MRFAHPAAPAHAVGLLASLLLTAIASPAQADVSLNNMFGDHMVLQQGIKNKVWGKADPSEAVTVTLGGQSHSTTAGADGMWHVFLDPVQEYGGPHTLTVKGKNTITFNDVLIGEVWVCAGQSNMQWSINNTNDADLEKAAAKFPNIRLISVPNRWARRSRSGTSTASGPPARPTRSATFPPSAISSAGNFTRPSACRWA
jgi:sialate O-acetylesterase